MENTIEVSGIDLGRVAFVYTKPYSAEAQNKEGSRFKDKYYSVFSFGQKSFTIPSDDEVVKFLMDRKERAKIKTLFLLKSTYEGKDAEGKPTTVHTYTFDGFVTVEESLAYKQSSFEESVLDAKIQSIMKGNFKAEAELSEADIEALEQ
jgi:hypothetical protein